LRNFKTLVDLIGKPEKGELTYDGKKRLTRIEALKELKKLEDQGDISPPEKYKGVNLHLHTNESFSLFKSPTEAAWFCHRAGIEVCGINDHYTIKGHKEFREACKILGQKATYSIEAIALSTESKMKGERYNDPKNPGRVYLCGKGVIHPLESDSSNEKLLKAIKNELKNRCTKMTKKANSLINDIDSSLKITFDDVLKLTPHGNVTERHIAQAITNLINNKFQNINSRRRFLFKLVGNIKDEDIIHEYKLQNLIRNRLLKAGGPAFVEEPSKAFPSIERIVQLFRGYGSIPTYPILGNPITEKEISLDALFHELEQFKIFAVEVIPRRNTKKRLDTIFKIAKKYGLPIFNGTEHNTKTPSSLLDKFSSNSTYLHTFKRGANLLLGHSFLSINTGEGYINLDGELTFQDREKGIDFFSFIGKITWPNEVQDWLFRIQKKKIWKLLLGLFQIYGVENQHSLAVNNDFRIPEHLLNKIMMINGEINFLDEESEDKFKELACKFIRVFYNENHN
jgi:predicted metal-dependent phosphoesterase TrpH